MSTTPKPHMPLAISPALFVADISLFSSLLCHCFLAVISLFFGSPKGNFIVYISVLMIICGARFGLETAKSHPPVDGIGLTGA
jgi:hypothetical protein